MNHLDNERIIYFDNHLLVVNKPSEMATQPDLTELAKQWVKKKYNKPGAVFLHPIHRLDKPVSGLVLFARTSKALSRLQEMMREGKIQKKYVALIEGKLPQKEGKLVHHLVHGSHRAELDPAGKEAILHYKVIGDHRVEIELVTGRYHQIRAQLGAVKCPVIGDLKYGSTKPWPQGIALHHKELTCEHPVTHVVQLFRAPCPF